MKKLRWVFALLLVGSGCSDSASKQPNGGTAWAFCETTRDCEGDFVCIDSECRPPDDTNIATNTTTNSATNGATNGSTNGSTNGGINNTNGEVCPLTAAPVPAELPAVHEVRFQVSSEYPTPVWIASQGWFCTPFGIADVDLQIGFRCGCECPDPGGAYAQELRQVMPGESVDVVWDGRQAVTYPTCADCGEPVFETAAVQQPAAAGTYTVTIPFLVNLPDECTDSGNGRATCGPPATGAGDAFTEFAPMCDLGFPLVGQANVALPGPQDPAQTIEVPVVLPVGP